MAIKKEHSKKTTKGHTGHKSDEKRKNDGRTGAQSTRTTAPREAAKTMRIAAERAQAAILSARRSGQDGLEKLIKTATKGEQGHPGHKSDAKLKNGGGRTGAQTRPTAPREGAKTTRIAAERAQAAILSARRSGQNDIEKLIETVTGNTEKVAQLATPTMEIGGRMANGGMGLADTLLRATLSWIRLGTATMGAWQRGMVGAT